MNDEYPPLLVTRYGAEPFHLLPTPTRCEVVRRHDDHQKRRALDCLLERIAERLVASETRIHPEAQSTIRLFGPQFHRDLFTQVLDERATPLGEQVAVIVGVEQVELGSMRVADERIVFVTAQICHGSFPRLPILRTCSRRSSLRTTGLP